MIEYVDIMRCDVHISHSMSRAKDVSFLLFGASLVRIVSLHRFRLSEFMLETSALNADFQQLMSKIINTFCSNTEVFRREFIKIILDKTQSTITMWILAMEFQRAGS